MPCKRCDGSGIIGGRCSGFCSCKAGKKAFNEAYPKDEDKKLYSENDMMIVASLTYNATMEGWDKWPGTKKIVKEYVKSKNLKP